MSDLFENSVYRKYTDEELKKFPSMVKEEMNIEEQKRLSIDIPVITKVPTMIKIECVDGKFDETNPEHMKLFMKCKKVFPDANDDLIKDLVEDAPCLGIE